jgi:hypothetical protein
VTWSEPVVVNDNADPAASDQFQPSVAAGPGGAVAVAWSCERRAWPWRHRYATRAGHSAGRPIVVAVVAAAFGIVRERGRCLVVHRALEDEALRAAAAESSGERALIVTERQENAYRGFASSGDMIIGRRDS